MKDILPKFLMTSLTVSLLSCGNSFELKETPNFPFGGSGQVRGEAIDFATVKTELLEGNCLSCHQGYADYQTFFGSKESALTQIRTGRMPKGGPALENRLVVLLQNWIASGAPEFVDNGQQDPTDPKQPDPQEPDPIPVRKLEFATIKTEILNKSCLSCHGGYADYNNFFKDKEDALAAIASARMPLGGPALDTDLVNLLQDWIDAGAPEFESDVSNPQILEPTWASIKENIIAPKCLQCHGSGTFLPLATRQDFFDRRKDLLDDFKDVEDSKLIRRLQSNSNPMPPSWSGLDKLTTEEINIVIQWVEKGLP